MKIELSGLHIIITSSKLASILAKLTGLARSKDSKPAMGFAIPPNIIILRVENHPMNKQWINHEKIHIRQFAESLGMLWVYSKFEYLYFRFFKGYSHVEAYRMESIEQEAYLNQKDVNYLSIRKVFNTVKYMMTKVRFHTDDKYNVVVDK